MLVIPLSTVDTLATLVYPTVDSGITITSPVIQVNYSKQLYSFGLTENGGPEKRTKKNNSRKILTGKCRTTNLWSSEGGKRRTGKWRTNLHLIGLTLIYNRV